MGKHDKALEFLFKAKDLGRDDAWLHSEIAWNYKEKDDYIKAIEHFLKSEERGKDSAWFYSNTAECFEAVKDFEKALLYYKKALEKDEEDSSEYKKKIKSIQGKIRRAAQKKAGD